MQARVQARTQLLGPRSPAPARGPEGLAPGTGRERSMDRCSPPVVFRSLCLLSGVCAETDETRTHCGSRGGRRVRGMERGPHKCPFLIPAPRSSPPPQEKQRKTEGKGGCRAADGFQRNTGLVAGSVAGVSLLSAWVSPPEGKPSHAHVQLKETSIYRL